METQIDVTQTLSTTTQSGGKEETSQAKIHNRLITTRIVGVSYENRQEVIAKCKPNESIWLERESTNPFDCNAVRVTRNDSEQLGFLNRFLAAAIAATLDAYGLPIRGKVEQIIGSSYDGYSLGLVISFRLPKLMRQRGKHGLLADFYWLED